MKVKYKAFLLALISVLILIGLTYMIFNYTYFGYIQKQQEREIKRSFEIIDFVINNEKEDLKSMLADWAHWDDTYEFISGAKTEYIKSNLGDDTFTIIDLRMMVFLNRQGNIYFSKSLGIDPSTKNTIEAFVKGKTYGEGEIGLMHIAGRTYLIGASPITDSKGELLSKGSLVFVREIGKSMLTYIKNISDVSLRFELNKSALPAAEGFISIQNSKKILGGSRALTDFLGQPSITLKVFKDQNNNNIINFFFNSFMLWFILILAFMLYCISMIANKYILNRLSKLNSFMNMIADTKNTTLSLSMPGRDDFSALSDSINKMLAELTIANEEMKEMDNRYRLIMEATNDGYLEYYIKTKELYISQEWKSLIGYEGQDGRKLRESFIAKILPDSFKDLKAKYDEVVTGSIEYFTAEYKVIGKSEEPIWVLQRGKIVEKDEEGRPLRVISTLSNITDRKRYEEEILFLSYSDKLTGLKSRAYMEKQIEQLDSASESNYFIILGDLNGLKLINDSLGHKEGDKLLQIIGKILIRACMEDDIVSRWGGDEFIILIKNKNKLYVSGLIDRIKEDCKTISEFPISVSIALGYAERDRDNVDSDAVMSIAEKRMYRNKLMENKSARNAAISSLLRTLHEKHSETEEHTMRIKNLSLRLGRRLGLSQDKLDELELLSLLHDIGKIGIPEQILMKASPLTEDEWTIMKGHTDIGYRIAKSTPELSHIADEILSHHEKFDGTGYPNGLRGEGIPLISRILNIIDSYDVMTHKRVYKAAMTDHFALEELKRCAGSQFDPFLVEEFIKLLEADSML